MAWKKALNPGLARFSIMKVFSFLSDCSFADAMVSVGEKHSPFDENVFLYR